MSESSTNEATNGAEKPAEQPAAESTINARKQPFLSRQQKAAVFITLMVLVGCWLCLRWLVHARIDVDTDNAFIETNIHYIAARVPGTVIAVHVNDNQQVKKGDLLVELDKTDYQVAEKRSEAALGVVRNELASDQSQVAAASAALVTARTRLEQAEKDLQRGEQLFKREVIPKEQLEHLQTGMKVAKAQVQEAKEQLKMAEAIADLAAGAGGQARIKQKEAELADSRLKLGYTQVFAPVDGMVTRKGVEVGSTIQAGQALLALVSLDDTWIIANYKESQISHMKPGQKVSFKVDTYPGKKFSGVVDSIMAGTGAAFSLLPPENATGNYVKVVQRVPVKILIDKTSDPDHVLRVGMSVVPVVHTGRSTGEVLKDFNPFK